MVNLNQDVYDNQVGPDVQGQGSIAIYTNRRNAKILYSPTNKEYSKAFYSIDGSRPDIPIPVNEWIEIRGAVEIYIDYDVQTKGDIKICWSILS